MGKSSKGFKSGTRRLLKKKSRSRTKITDTLKSIDINDRVVIKIDAGIHGGMPHPRYQGNAGIIAEKRGESYLVNIKDKNKAKTLICRPEHLKKIEGGN
ncbi:MAG: 50S ribosomal protein L21e [Candidatus Aenigmarchaeota archaeon]|nr:50S ribosomal protein L21e [Candidatus Aenigmarchaeota archaeon]MCK5321718.1 50S ribosomal protein L21e [Candidatus Aenigmarchaeota archaeon]